MRYDAIIIGGGHNGLVTAAYLARAGKSVLVLERREMLGGCAVTEEIWPGYRVSTGAYLSSLLQDRIVQELELERFGYQVDAQRPRLLLRLPRRPLSLLLAGREEDARRDREVLRSATPRLSRSTRRQLERLARGRGIAAPRHAAGVSPAEARRLHRVSEDCWRASAN